MNTSQIMYFGDARRMARVPDHSVQLVVTSPPYWQLKDYGNSEQIGFDHSYRDYINNLNLVWLECGRVLHPGCRLCVNIGDQFARATHYGRYKVIPIRTEIIRFCETIGFDFMGAIVWRKVTTCHASGGGSVMGSYPHPRNGILKLDYEHILLFKKSGSAPKVTAEQKRQSIMTAEEWNEYFSGHWNFPGEKQSDHGAVFPEELPRRLIRMFSFVGETVLDPFAGSGTTLLAAAHTGRDGVGYEINADFRPIIENRLAGIPGLTFREDPARPDSQTLTALPYLFEDPVAIDKRQGIPERLLQYDEDSHSDYSASPPIKVVAVLSPTRLQLSDHTIISLLGIKERDSAAADAIAFLKDRVCGRKVVLRREQEAAPTSVYVYLENRTFVNARMVRQGLADLDTSAVTTNRALLRLKKVRPTSSIPETCSI